MESKMSKQKWIRVSNKVMSPIRNKTARKNMPKWDQRQRKIYGNSLRPQVQAQLSWFGLKLCYGIVGTKSSLNPEKRSVHKIVIFLRCPNSSTSQTHVHAHIFTRLGNFPEERNPHPLPQQGTCATSLYVSGNLISKLQSCFLKLLKRNSCSIYTYVERL